MLAARVVREALGLGTALAMVAWYAVNALFLKAILKLPALDALERLAYLAIFVALALLLAIGAYGAWAAGARSLGDAAWAGATAGVIAAIPVYLLVASTVAVLFLVVVPLLSALVNPPAQAGLVEVLQGVIVGAMWAAPLLALGTGALLAALGAASGAAYFALAHR